MPDRWPSSGGKTMNDRMKTALEMAEVDADAITDVLEVFAKYWEAEDARYVNFALMLAREACDRAKRVKSGALMECRFAAALETNGDYSIHGWRDRAHGKSDEKGWMRQLLDDSGADPISEVFGTVLVPLPRVEEVVAEVDGEGEDS